MYVELSPQELYSWQEPTQTQCKKVAKFKWCNIQQLEVGNRNFCKTIQHCPQSVRNQEFLHTQTTLLEFSCMNRKQNCDR